MSQTETIQRPTSKMKVTDHHVSVTVTVYDPKTVTTEYFIEQGIFERIAHDVQYAHRTGEFTEAVFNKLNQLACVIRVGDSYTKCRFDVGHMLDVYHQHNQAELAEDEAIFSEKTIDETPVKTQWAVTKIVYLSVLLEVSRRHSAQSSLAYGTSDIDALTMLPDTLPEYSEGAVTLQDVCQHLRTLRTDKLGAGANFVLNCFANELKKSKFKPMPHQVAEN